MKLSSANALTLSQTSPGFYVPAVQVFAASIPPPPPCFLPHKEKENLHHLNHNETVICKCFNPFPNKPWFLLFFSTSLLKTLWEKEKLLVTSNFSFSHSVFYPFEELSAIFMKFEFVVCKLFQFGRV